MANEIQFASSVVKVDGTTVAKVTSINKNSAMSEVDVTGAEDVSGALVQEQFIPVSIGQTLDLEGISVSGAAAEYEDGQSALIAAAENGTEVVLQVLKPAGYGFDYTGYFTSLREGASAKDVYKWSGSFRVNSKQAVTP